MPFQVSPSSRRETRCASRRDAILDVAEALFLEFGYAGTAMSKIAAHLGGSKGTLWKYYPSKALLFSAVIDRACAAFRQKLEAIISNGDDLEGTLRRFCLEFVQKITMPESVALHRLVTGESTRFPEVGRIFHNQAVRPTRQLLADLISKGMGMGFLRQENPSIAAQQLLGLCMCGCHQLLVFGVIERADSALIDSDSQFGVMTFLRAYAVACHVQQETCSCMRSG
jgi:AcrR family transcriptional regulator